MLFDTQEEAMAEVGRCLNDHRLITLGERKFQPSDALEIHLESRNWLEAKLALPFNGRTVVVTHHGPSPTCQHPSFDPSPISTAFWSDIDTLVAEADLWIYGHTHRSADTQIHGARLISNQRGYPRERGTGYQPNYVIECVFCRT